MGFCDWITGADNILRPRKRVTGPSVTSRRKKGSCAQLLFNKKCTFIMRIVQELCESRGGRPGLSAVLTSLLVSVDVKIY